MSAPSTTQRPLVLLTVGLIVGALAGTGTTAIVMRDDPEVTTPASAPAVTASPATSIGVTGKISSPTAGAVVRQEEVATGAVHGIGDGRRVWILVEVGRFYPQDGPLPLLPDGRWSGTVVIGAPRDEGKTFILHAVDVGSSGHEQFANYLTLGRRTGDFPGIQREGLLPDVHFHDSVTVTRR